MSRWPSARAPVSAPSRATLLAPAARDARGRERSRRSPGQRQVCVGVQAFLNTKRVARKLDRSSLS